MRKRMIHELAIYEIDSKRDVFPLIKLKDLFIKKTSEIVYFTLDNNLYGIICVGDVLNHNENGNIKINRKFTALKEFNDESALDIFLNSPHIHKVPVVNKQGILLGDYSRWDDNDHEFMDWIASHDKIWKKAGKYFDSLKYSRILIVSSESKDWIIQKFLQKIGQKNNIALVKKEELCELSFKNTKTLLCVADEDEIRGIKCLLEMNADKYYLVEFITFLNLYINLDEFDKKDRRSYYSISKEGKELGISFKKMESGGVFVFGLYNNTCYISNYFKEFRNRMNTFTKIYPIKNGEFWPVNTPMGKEFFGELLLEEDYQKGIAQENILQGHKMHKPQADFSNKYYNVCAGKRKTCYQPNKYTGKIYFFGECLIMGAYVEDKFTIESWLQNKLNQEGLPYLVENCGSYDNAFEVMKKITYYEGDIVIIWLGGNSLPGIHAINLKDIFEENQAPAEWALSALTHPNHKITKLISDRVFEMIRPVLKEETQSRSNKADINFQVDNYQDILGVYIQKIYLERYFSPEQFSENQVTGCMVIDTGTDFSHIEKVLEEAGKYVNQLILFVSEYKADFSGSVLEYISLLLKNVEQKLNTVVIPGENFVPYYNYFQSYYLDSISISQARADAQIFADCIAKFLQVSYRFALSGSSYTRFDIYNTALDEMLPLKGIQFIKVIV